MILFNKKNHKYTGKGIEYTSVTSFIENYKNKFDENYWSEYKAVEAILNGLIKDKDGSYLKKRGFFSEVEKNGLDFMKKKVDKKLLNKIKAEILKGWKVKNKNSQTKGTKYHDIKESSLIREGVSKFRGFDLPVYGRSSKGPADNYSRELIGNGCYPEFLVYNEKLSLAGQIDKLYLIGFIFYLDDYKTNEKINMTSYNNKKMKAPFDFLDDCNFNHYTLQLNIYALLLEEMKLKCGDMILSHYDTTYIIPKLDIKSLIYKERGL